MKTCPFCKTLNLDTSRFCDECGARLAVVDAPAYEPPSPTHTSPPSPVEAGERHSSVPSIEEPPIESEPNAAEPTATKSPTIGVAAHAKMVIERGNGTGTEFALIGEETMIGRWDADNGIFPDIDLDVFDSDAKVSRRHARVIFRNGSYFIEDLGSTNGTYVNRGRRLLPGTPHVLSDGDEVIVGKTFLRFNVIR